MGATQEQERVEMRKRIDQKATASLMLALLL
jgi:hypothetical protein